LSKQCQAFAVDLLDQVRSSKELDILLNFDPDLELSRPPVDQNDRKNYSRLKLAIAYKQKKASVESQKKASVESYLKKKEI